MRTLCPSRLQNPVRPGLRSLPVAPPAAQVHRKSRPITPENVQGLEIVGNRANKINENDGLEPPRLQNRWESCPGCPRAKKSMKITACKAQGFEIHKVCAARSGYCLHTQRFSSWLHSNWWVCCDHQLFKFSGFLGAWLFNNMILFWVLKLGDVHGDG